MISLVGSVNSGFNSYYSACSEFKNLDEKYHPMLKMYQKAVEYYAGRNGYFPKDIIILQNAVPKDQVKILKENFIERAVNVKFESKEKPSVTFMMVNTKNDERFFEGTGNDLKNPKAGTIVSDSMVSQQYDFYMMSQYTTKGSAIPPHYQVIYSDSDME